MTIESRLPLLAQTADFSQIPQNILQTAQGIGQIRQQQAEAPARQAILQGQVDQIPLQRQETQGAIDLHQQQIQSLKDTDAFKSTVFGALQGKQLLDAGDTAGFLQLADARAKNITDRGGQVDATAQIADLVRQGKIDEAKQRLEGGIQLGKQAGILKADENSHNSPAFNDAEAILNAQGITAKSPGYAQQLQATITKLNAAGTTGAQPYFQFLPTSTGYAVGNARTGNIQQPGEQGAVLLPVPADANVKGNVARSEASGRTQGEAQGTAAATLPQVEANASQTLDIVNQVLAHPGLESAVGVGTLNPAGYLPGTDATNFKILSDQLQGKAFLQAFQALKGAGAITEQEGSKATAAIARLNRKQSVEEYKKGVRELRDIIETGVDRAKSNAVKGVADTPPARPPLSSFGAP